MGLRFVCLARALPLQRMKKRGILKAIVAESRNLGGI